jgi:hypothetical protein
VTARWLLAGLVVVALLVAIQGPPTAATLAAFTSEGSADGQVTAGRWSTPVPPSDDPNAGFVTGGGWIDSPPGACSLPGCTAGTVGRANFGFVSKYQGGSNLPQGETEFVFKEGNLNFHASVYTALVVSGCKAQYRGFGTINGSGPYSFILTAYDAQATGQCAGQPEGDRFRIQIKSSVAVVVYDNVKNVPDDIEAAIPGTSGQLGGGSIVIHKAK